jgi:phosphomannomutase/phosphoglucomutase
MDNFYGHDDGAFSSLRLISILDGLGTSLSDLVNSLPKYITSPEIKLGYPDEDKFDFIKNNVTSWMRSEFSEASFTDIDGFRADGENYMLIVRASQNGPYITIKYEAKDETIYKELGEKISSFLKQDPKVNWSEGVNIEEISKA